MHASINAPIHVYNYIFAYMHINLNTFAYVHKYALCRNFSLVVIFVVYLVANIHLLVNQAYLKVLQINISTAMAFSKSSLVFDDPSLFNKVATESRDFLRTLTPLLEMVLSKPFECFQFSVSMVVTVIARPAICDNWNLVGENLHRGSIQSNRG